VQQIEIYKYTQIGFWSFCNVYLCIHLKKITFWTKQIHIRRLRRKKTFAEMENRLLCICVFVYKPKKSQPQSVCSLVLEGRYNSTDQQRISYSKYHEIEIGSSSPVKKGKGCSCKKGCGKNCGCKKKGFRCHRGCFCNGNCCAKGV